MRVRWLRAALRDLDGIAARIAGDNPAAAERTVRRVREAVDQLALPPGVPDDIYQTLKQAMIDTTKDPGFVSAMKERGFDGGYRSPEELDATLNRLRDAPPELVDILRRMYNGS